MSLPGKRFLDRINRINKMKTKISLKNPVNPVIPSKLSLGGEESPHGT